MSVGATGARVEFRDVAGIRTRVLLAGPDGRDGEDGPAVLLVQPGGAVADVWLPLMARLAGAARLVAPDLPGHGFTPYPGAGGGAPHPLLLGHLTALLDDLGIGRCAVFGSSLGAHLALLLHLGDPARFDRVALSGSASSFASEDELHATVTRFRQTAATAAGAASLDGARRALQRYCSDGFAVPDELVLVHAISSAVPEIADGQARLFTDLLDRDAVRPFRVAERLGEVTAPCLVVWGREDRVSPFGTAAAGVGRLPGAEVVVFDDCGHMPYLERPGEVAAALLALLGR